MTKDVELLTGPLDRRFAFRFLLSVVRAMVPPGEIGTYFLLTSAGPVYVGRSDFCVRNRLTAGHPMQNKATHFTWEPRGSGWDAFCQEAFWFHRLRQRGLAANSIHPARPEASSRPCPFCGVNDLASLRHAMPHLDRATS